MNFELTKSISTENFAEMAQMYGVQGIECKEVYAIEALSSASTTVHGLIMSYALNSETLRPAVDNQIMDQDAKSLFFSCQVVTNVCATSALLGVLLNIDDKELVLGKELEEFRNFTKDFSPVDRGMAIANSDLLKKAHNTFASFESKHDTRHYPRYEDIKPSKKQKSIHAEDPDYHFVAFVPANGYIWELDGYNKVPIKLHKITGNWTEQIVPDLKERMARTGGIDFSLLSINKSPTHTKPTGAQSPPPTLSPSSSLSSSLPSSTQPDPAALFYAKLKSKVEGYLDAKLYNWQDWPLEKMEQLGEGHIIERHYNSYALGDHVDKTMVELLHQTTVHADLIAHLKLRHHAIAKLNELSQGNKDNDTRHDPVVATDVESHIFESEVKEEGELLK
ncbi:hypothetical protein [Absidia glauca]|uniref:ubiquitinyl hydrolase 1 n=1 Tax=Absidia glauca TaxID=4829 RepID=A0A168NGL6_ABSGL|nr:hypothetical protein [Absidia glauca]